MANILSMSAKVTGAPSIEGTVATVNLQVDPGADPSNQLVAKNGFITVSCAASLVSALNAGACTLTLSQP